ncbi:hypothetical protein CPB85DRAFT_539409 [Mucidula mucida]|nr:hypothetical protein CPB85DRAFT_539409 [Mucidula mucida]
MHAEKFMELVFRTPANWKADPVCKGILAAITANDDFKAALESFRKILNGPGTEHRLYPPIVALYAIVLKLLDAHDPLPDGDDRKTLKLAFSVNDPVELVDAVTKGLSPDIRSLFDSFTIHEKELSFSMLTTLSRWRIPTVRYAAAPTIFGFYTMGRTHFKSREAARLNSQARLIQVSRVLLRPSVQRRLGSALAQMTMQRGAILPKRSTDPKKPLVLVARRKVPRLRLRKRK